MMRWVCMGFGLGGRGMERRLRSGGGGVWSVLGVGGLENRRGYFATVVAGDFGGVC